MGAMKTHSTKIREHLRSARVSALTAEERRAKMREAEARAAGRHAGEDDAEPDPGSAREEFVTPKPATEVLTP